MLLVIVPFQHYYNKEHATTASAPTATATTKA
jgi:hypothetical protein